MRRLSLAVALAAFGTPGAAGAQAPPLRPPELVEEAEVEVPSDLRDPVAVVLRIQIEADGSVSSAEVVESAGARVDALARDALVRSRFRPALRGEVPIPSRVLYRWVLRPRRAPAVAEVPEGASTETGGASHEPGGDAEAEGGPDDAPAEGTSDEAPDAGLSASARVLRDREGVLERSAEAVDVVDIAAQRTRARDLGDVLARQQGIALQRAGGLGSRSRFSLGGLTDDQVRFFLDGVPLELAGIDAVANVPVGIIDAVEVYRGVVPIELGADALGGVVHLRTSDAERRTFGRLSYQAGSFNTHRLAGVARYHDPETGLIVGFRGFFDRTDNSYPTDVRVFDETGAERDATIRRFHDDFQGYNAAVDVGVVDRRWADRLQLSVFAAGDNRDLQHNIVMTIPYGAVTLESRSYGGTLRYQLERGALRFDAVTGLAWGRNLLDDRGRDVVTWFGEVITTRAVGGEIQREPVLQSLDDLTAFGRATTTWAITDDHELALGLTARFSALDGDNRLFGGEDGRDPLTVRQDLATLVSGLSYGASFAEGRFENRAFVKHYLWNLATEEPLFGGNFTDLRRREQFAGVGNGLRVQLAGDWLWAKASYEWAVRLPDPVEVFGNGQLIRSSLELDPERSHNLNLGVQMDRDGDAGRFKAEAHFFFRRAEDLIVLLSGNPERIRFENVFAARIRGVESALRWTSPGEWVVAGGNVTYQDVRNVSPEGLLGTFDGDRIPNRPYFFANGDVSLGWSDAFLDGAMLRAGSDVRFVEGFFRS
ncbi:MAG: TonB-dependent receptor plug domain-containing protein, partial [Myxococcota bacterium]